MHWLSTALKDAYSKLAPGEYRSKSVDFRPAWGDGLCDLSLPTLWYRCTWDTVSDDELALLIPSLTSDEWKGAARDAFGPRIYLYGALCARLRWAVMRLTSAHCSAQQALDAITRCNVISTFGPLDAWADADRYFGLFYRAPPKVRSSLRIEADACNGERQHAAWLFEFAVLACLDRIFDDASLGRESASPSREFDRPVDVSDVLMASIYASFNGAYVYPQFTAYHEMFTVGAWLGYLARGRAALMPVFIAEYLVDRFGGPQDRHDPERSTCDRLLHYHADLVVGRERLLQVARRVATSGHAVKLHPKAAAASDSGLPELLNGLSKHLRERLKHLQIYA
jgi:hypothetical protein